MTLKQLSDINSEMALIGCILVDNKSIIHVIDQLEPSDFYNTINGDLWTCIVQMFAKNASIDIITLSNYAKSQFPKSKYDVHIVECNELGYTSEDITQHFQTIKEFSLKRQLKNKCFEYEKKIDLATPAKDIILDFQHDLLGITNQNGRYDVDFFQEFEDAEISLNNRLQNNKHIEGYEWSIKELTEVSGGIELGYDYTFGALKKTGKSKFIIDQIHSLVEQNIPSLFLSLEMGKKQVVRWLWSRFAEVNNFHIRFPIDSRGNRNLSKVDIDKLMYAKEKYQNRLIELSAIYTKSYLDLNQIKAKIYQEIQARDIKVVFLDYLQRCKIEGRKNQNEAKQIEDFCNRLADVTKDYNIALIKMSQLANIAEKQYATIANLKHSGGIGEATNFAAIFNRLARINPQKYKNSNRMYIDFWQRDGISSRIEVEYDLTVGKFYDPIEQTEIESPY